MRFYYYNHLKKNVILDNSNRGTNMSIQGKTNFFDFNNNLYCLNSFYLQNFIKTRKKAIIHKNKNFYKTQFNNKTTITTSKFFFKYKNIKKLTKSLNLNEYKINFYNSISVNNNGLFFNKIFNIPPHYIINKVLLKNDDYYLQTYNSFFIKTYYNQYPEELNFFTQIKN